MFSNDPSFENKKKIKKSLTLMPLNQSDQIYKKVGIKIDLFYATRIQHMEFETENNVSEDMSLEPLTDYSKFKAQCEKILNTYKSDDFEVVTIRPATVCGYSKKTKVRCYCQYSN